MFCKYCGTKLPDDTLFCSHCGKKLFLEQLDPKEKTSAASSVAEILDKKSSETPPKSAGKKVSLKKPLSTSEQPTVLQSSEIVKSEKTPPLSDDMSTQQPPTQSTNIQTHTTMKPPEPPRTAPDPIPTYQPPQKKNSGKMIVTAAAVAVLAIGCVAGGLQVKKNREEALQLQAELLATQKALEEEQRAAQEKAEQEQKAAIEKAEQEQKAAELQKAEAEKAKAEAEAQKARAEAEKAQADAQKAQADAQKAQQKAAQTDYTDYEDQDWYGSIPYDTFDAYIRGFCNAVNTNSFSSVSASMIPDSDIYNEQKRVVASLADQGITEKVIKADIINEWAEGDDVYVIVSDELIGVTYGDGSYKEIAQSYAYYMRLQSDGLYRMYKMVEQ